MKRSLLAKLIFSYLIVALIVVVVVSAVIGLTSGQSLMDLVVDQQTALLSESAQSYYTANGTMQGFIDYYTQSRQPAENQPQPGIQKDRPDMRGLHGLVDAQFHALLPTFGYDVGETVPSNLIEKAIAVDVDGQTVAWIIPDTRNEFQLSPEEQVFMQRTSLAVAISAAVGILAAVSMGIFLARGMVKPIRRLTEASQAMASGDLQQEVKVTSEDELGLLTDSFNKMSADLLHADQQRKRLTADITHDLSTPLQIISGYVEMLEDGAVSLTPQRLEIIKTEIEHLRRLVGDLTTLTQVEAGGLDIQLQALTPAFLMESIFRTYQPITAAAGVNLVLDVQPNLPEILVDEVRMLQVIKNLVENALRYTHAGGTITLAAAANNSVNLKVMDTGSGIDAEDLPYIFDRFYRADRNRTGNTGKMGLGLAICKALVNALGGTIYAESGGHNQGTVMTISFPVNQKA